MEKQHDDTASESKLKVLVAICNDYNKDVPTGEISAESLGMDDEVFLWAVRKLFNEEYVHVYEDPPCFGSVYTQEVEGMTAILPTSKGLEYVDLIESCGYRKHGTRR